MKQSHVLILTLGVFSIINTEMGVIGILPLIAEQFQVSIATAGLLISLFALAVALSGPIMPLLCSGINRKTAMLFVLGIFLICNIFSMFTTSFIPLLIARVLPAFFHPIYCSLAFTVAAASVRPEEAPKAISKVLMGVSAGMVLGVPIVSFIASVTSLKMAMLSFALVNALAFLATLCFIPSLPVNEKPSYGAQVSILKKPIVWLSIITVLLLNGAIFGVYSYLAEYLKNVTHISAQMISAVLLVYGLANIIGNMIAGQLLSKNALAFIVCFPLALGFVYVALGLTGQFPLSMTILSLLWGILGGAGANINQYWLTSAAPKAPEFTNGLFLASTNLGTTIGTTLCGLFIAGMGIPYFVLGGILFSFSSLIVTFLRVRLSSEKIKRPSSQANPA